MGGASVGERGVVGRFLRRAALICMRLVRHVSGPSGPVRLVAILIVALGIALVGLAFFGALTFP